MAIARFSSLAQLDAILYANRKKELTEPQISEGTWRKERRASYSREFKVRLAKQALQPGAVGCHERCNSDPHPTPEIRSRG